MAFTFALCEFTLKVRTAENESYWCSWYFTILLDGRLSFTIKVTLPHLVQERMALRSVTYEALFNIEIVFVLFFAGNGINVSYPNGRKVRRLALVSRHWWDAQRLQCEILQNKQRDATSGAQQRRVLNNVAGSTTSRAQQRRGLNNVACSTTSRAQQCRGLNNVAGSTTSRAQQRRGLNNVAGWLLT